MARLSTSSEGLYLAALEVGRLKRARDEVKASTTMSRRAVHVIVRALDKQIGRLNDHITVCMNADEALP
jgi:hypothetical protein